MTDHRDIRVGTLLISPRKNRKCQWSTMIVTDIVYDETFDQTHITSLISYYDGTSLIYKYAYSKMSQDEACADFFKDWSSYGAKFVKP